MVAGRSRITLFPEAGASNTVPEMACSGDGESGLDWIPHEAEVVGVKADAAFTMTAAATLRTLSD